MKIIGKRSGGDISVYEVIGFRFIKEEGYINCTISDSLNLEIRGKTQSITNAMSEMFCKQLFTTGCLDLLDEDVIIETKLFSINVHLQSHGWDNGIPIRIAAHDFPYGFPVDIVRRSW